MPTVFLPEELIAEILSFLDVKIILRFKCLNKLWINTFISDSYFVERHLQNSSQNSHLTLIWSAEEPLSSCCMRSNVLTLPVHDILKIKPFIDVYININYLRRYPLEFRCKFVGSCNGLLCLLYNSDYWTQPAESWFWFYNPATREKSNKLGSIYLDQWDRFKFTFGYDASTKTYKVVAFLVENANQDSWKSEVKVFSLGDNCWRNIQSFPVVPFDLSNGVHLSGTVNWLAMDKFIIYVQQFVILSLDLSTERYKQFLLPLGFDDVSLSQPALCVLLDCLCFSHDSKKTEFILWQMKKYGVRDSWTQILKISYMNLEMRLPNDNFESGFQLKCLYINGDKAILANRCNKFQDQAFIYNLKDKSVRIIKSEAWIEWFDKAKDYSESLVPVCW